MFAVDFTQFFWEPMPLVGGGQASEQDLHLSLEIFKCNSQIL